MNDVERVFHEDLKRSAFSEAIADDDYDILDGLINEDDDTSSESEDM